MAAQCAPTASRLITSLQVPSFYLAKKCHRSFKSQRQRGTLNSHTNPFSIWGALLLPPKPTPASKMTPGAAAKQGRATGFAGSATGDPGLIQAGGSDMPNMQHSPTSQKNASDLSNTEPLGAVMHDAGACESSDIVLHEPSLPPQLICIAESPNSLISKHEFDIRIGNPCTY